MVNLELALLLGVSAVILAPVVVDTAKAFEVPRAAAGLVVAWLTPQILAVEEVETYVTLGEFILFTTACIVCTCVGFQFKLPRSGGYPPARIGALQSRIPIALLLTLGGVGAGALAREIGGGNEFNQATGATAVLYGLSRFAFIGGTCALLLAIKTRSGLAWLAVAIGLGIEGFEAVRGFRREGLFILAFAPCCALFLTKGWRPSRTLVGVGSLLLGVLVVSAGSLRAWDWDSDRSPSTGAGRNTTYENRAMRHERMVLQSVELRHALMDMRFVQTSGRFEFGASLINSFTFQYISSTFFGAEIKAAMTFPTRLEEVRSPRHPDNLAPGATRTGIGDAYVQFGWAGPALFALLGRLLGILYCRAQAGDLRATALYINLAAVVLLSFTHRAGMILQNGPFIWLGVLLCIPRASKPSARCPDHAFTPKD